MNGKLRCRSVVLVLLMSLLPTRLHAMTPAGTLIFVQGKASYFDATSGVNTEARSNAVVLSVRQSAGIGVHPAAPVSSPPGQYIQFPHILSNIGNGVDTILLSLAARGSLPLEALTIFNDPNENGRVDAGETPITTLLEIGMEQRRAVVVSALVPPAAQIGTTGTLYMTARSKFDPSKSVVTTDSVEVKNDTLLAPSLAAVPTGSISGDLPIEYTFTVLNIGIPEAKPVTTPVLLGSDDGIQGISINFDGVLLSFPIPANTRFEGAGVQAPENGLLVYKINEKWTNAFNPNQKNKVKGVGMIVPNQGGIMLPAQTASFRVQVRVSPKISETTLSAIGAVSYTHNAEIQIRPTNLVIHSARGEPESASFTNAQGEKRQVYHTGETIYFAAMASSLNQNSAVIEAVGPLVITSPTSGDRESIFLIESGENTGLFKGFLLPAEPPPTGMATPTWRTVPTPPGKAQGLSKPLTKTENGVLDAVQNSLLQLELVLPDRNTILKDEVVIDPSGVVFNSLTNAPLQGVKVTLVGSDDQPVLLGIGKNPVITGEDGRFAFDAPVEKEYKILIDRASLPAGFSYPSVLPVHNLTPMGRTIDPNGSYGQRFKLTSSTIFDAPADPPDPPLFLQKTADKQSVEIGDVVTYTVTIKNQSAILPIMNIRLLDQPPIGVSYLRGSAKCIPPGETASQPLADPANGYPVVFTGCGIPIADRLDKNKAMTITYKTIVGPGALVGDGINTINATGNSILGPTTSNTASAAVRIVPGVFTDRAIVMGKVFIDMNEDGKQDEGEPGVPGIRLVMEDGTWAITDKAGKYSIYGLTPTTHLLKVDPLTLHRRFILTSSSTRFAGDPKTRFIDLTPGELHKANFTIAPLPKETWEPIIKEREARLGNYDDSSQALNLTGTMSGQAPGIAPPASGTVGGQSVASEAPDIESKSADENINLEEPEDDAEETESGDPSERLKALLDKTEPGFKVVSPSERAVIPIPSTNVVITGDARYDFKLLVNDAPIPDDRVGTIVVSPEKNLAAIEWVAVPLQVGKNIVAVTGYDPFGNVRAQGVRTLFVPGNLAHVEITPDPTTLPADGVSTTTLTLRLFDGDKLPISTRTFLTITTRAGKFLENDLDPDTPGLQVAIEGSEAHLHLIASEQVEDAIIAAKTRGDESALGEATVSFLPPLRDMLAVGIIDSRINLRNLKGKIVPIDPQDRFEEGFTGDGRAAFYLKGKIKGSTLLTLAYDSDKGKGERLFRDIQPDEFYPIYGDSSVKGFDAQSTEKLYVKVEQGKSYILFGDYTPGFTESDLMAYQRALSGVKYHFEDEQAAFTAFHNRSPQRQVVDRIPANGTSGFYTLNHPPVLENSDRVEILTLNRNQPELVIKTEPMTRFVDYTLSTLTGRILFKSPIPSFDNQLNPMVIKVTYETLGGGIEFDTYGMDGKKKISEQLQVGGTLIQSNEPGNRLTLYGAHLRSRFSRGVYAMAEVAASDSIVQGAPKEGVGFKTTLSFKPSKTVDATTYWLKTDAGFQNPSANITGGKLESGLRIGYVVREGTVLGEETIRSTDAITGTRRSSTDLHVEQVLGLAKGEVGIKHIEDRFRLAGALQAVTTDTARLKVTTPFPRLPRLMTSLEYEWGLNRSAYRTALTSDYKISEKTKLYGKKEWLSGPSDLGSIGMGEGGRHTKSIIGIDSTAFPGTTGFTEYRMADSIAGRENQAAVGLRNRYQLKPGISMTSTFEQTEILSGAGEDNVVLSAGVEHLARPDLKGSARMEMRNATTLIANLGTFAFAYRVKEGVSLLTRETLYREDGKGAKDDKWSSRFIMGTAVRPLSIDRVNLLSRYEFKYESSGISLSRVHVGSVEGNVSVNPKAVLFLKYANRIVHEGGVGFSIMTQMIEGRVTYDLMPKVDLGLEGRHIWQDRSGSQLWGYGVEGGYKVAQNLWLSLGYQINGLDQEQFTNGDAAASGIYTRLRYKFDEGLIQYLRERDWTLKGLRPS